MINTIRCLTTKSRVRNLRQQENADLLGVISVRVGPSKIEQNPQELEYKLQNAQKNIRTPSCRISQPSSVNALFFQKHLAYDLN